MSKTNTMVELIKQNKSLDGKKREQILDLAIIFESEFFKNIGLTSQQLNDKYSTGSYDLWKFFLEIPEIEKYIKKYEKEMLRKKAIESAKRSLDDGEVSASAAMKVYEAAREEEGGVNSKIVVIVSPFRTKNTFDEVE